MGEYRLYGIRHHGPGSARSLMQAFEAWQPDCLLIEGPPEAEAGLDWIGHAELVPPVALLIYRPDLPRQAVYYPFAEFSPEWQALQWAKGRTVPVRWIDLPQSAQLADADEKDTADAAPTQAAAEAEALVDPEPSDEAETSDKGNVQTDPTPDPFDLLGKAAGYGDGERYWEDLVEHRREAGDVFEAILELMTNLREGHPEPLRERRREASMRQGLRQALKDGFERIAVVVGAWHVPAINPKLPVKADRDLLRNLPKVKTETSWIPWTHSRLGWASGYGAGIESPGWYAHLWQHREHVATRWMARVARLLRAKGLDISSAHLIEAVRLAEALAGLRLKPQAGLSELNEATRAVLTQGQETPLLLIHEQLIIGQELGSVPIEMPQVPLQQDLEAQLRGMRLKLTATDQVLKIDLRKERDREKSALLHRLALLDVPWGELLDDSGRKGSFGESWQLRWEPEFALRLIEAGVWGHTLLSAASARTLDRARQAQVLGELTALLDQVLLADLPATIPILMQRIADRAALTSDTIQLLEALPPLGRMLRYGSVRQLESEPLRQMLDGLLARVCLGLPGAVRSLDEGAARALLEPIGNLHQMLRTLQEADWLDIWLDTLEDLAGDERLNGLLSGYFSRLLFDLGRWPLAQLTRQLSRTTSPGTPLPQAAAWIEGLLQGSGLLLVHHEALLGLLDRWLKSLNPEQFIETLPLLRRSFARFADPERRQIGELLKQGSISTDSDPEAAQAAAKAPLPEYFDPALAKLTLPILKTLLGAPKS